MSGLRFYSIGVSRHRIGSDGVGVTTLVGGHGCPLGCKYCLNPQCKRGSAPFSFTAEELYGKVSIDRLYFDATGGGITFGGGEPLLQAEFIRGFIEYTRKQGEKWRFSLETCASVHNDKLALLDSLIDEYIVDIKDMNAHIYKSYTGQGIELLYSSLGHLANFPEKVRIKIPLIEGFNTASDVDASESVLRGMGFVTFERLTYVTDVRK